MLGSYRSAFIALGLIVSSQVGAQAPNGSGAPNRSPAIESRGETPRDQQNPHAQREPLDVRIVGGSPESNGPRQREEHAEKREQSDLEAQWVAANAARKQARLAFGQTIIAGLATILAAVGTWFLVQTFRETQQAAAAAARSADQSEQANRQTRDLFFAVQRPWVRIAHEGPLDADLLQNRLSMTIPIAIKNIGKSPATDVSVLVKILNVRFPAIGIEEAVRPLAESGAYGGRSLFVVTTLLPGGKAKIRRQLDFDIRYHGTVGTRQNVLVDYAIVVRYSHQTAERQHSAVVAYTASFSNIPTLAMLKETISPDQWEVREIEGGTYLT